MDRPANGKGSEPPVITQEMIALFDEYTHLTLDRRAFMEKLSKLAGSAAAAAAIAPLIASDPAHAAIVAEDDPRVAASAVSFAGPAGELKGYLALPAGGEGRLPAVLVIHENRGLNPHIRDIARRLALEGFAALAVDLLSRLGGTPDDPAEAAQRFQLVFPGGLVEDSVAAATWLAAHPRSNGNVGAVGFCFGGGIVNQLAVAMPDLKAAVAYYGVQPTQGVDRIAARLMLHYAGLDNRVNAGIAAYEAALKAAGVDYQVFVYEGVNHAFNNDTSAARYDKAAADLAWSRTVAFLHETLG